MARETTSSKKRRAVKVIGLTRPGDSVEGPVMGDTPSQGSMEGDRG